MSELKASSHRSQTRDRVISVILLTPAFLFVGMCLWAVVFIGFDYRTGTNLGRNRHQCRTCLNQQVKCIMRCQGSSARVNIMSSLCLNQRLRNGPTPKAGRLSLWGQRGLQSCTANISGGRSLKMDEIMMSKSRTAGITTSSGRLMPRCTSHITRRRTVLTFTPTPDRNQSATSNSITRPTA